MKGLNSIEANLLFGSNEAIGKSEEARTLYGTRKRGQARKRSNRAGSDAPGTVSERASTRSTLLRRRRAGKLRVVRAWQRRGRLTGAGSTAAPGVAGRWPTRGRRTGSPVREEGRSIAGGALVAVIAIVYLAGALVFMDRFMPNTTIMGKDVSVETTAEVQDLLTDRRKATSRACRVRGSA